MHVPTGLILCLMVNQDFPGCSDWFKLWHFHFSRRSVCIQSTKTCTWWIDGFSMSNVSIMCAHIDCPINLVVHCWIQACHSESRIINRVWMQFGRVDTSEWQLAVSLINFFNSLMSVIFVYCNLVLTIRSLFARCSVFIASWCFEWLSERLLVWWQCNCTFCQQFLCGVGKLYLMPLMLCNLHVFK